MAVVAAGAFGFVLLAGLGARRADTAWDILRAEARGEEVLLDATTMDGTRSLTQ